jgi:hypothetical protein
VSAVSTTRIIIAIIVVFVLSVAFGTLIHAFLLKADYEQVAHLYRSAADTKFFVIFAAYLAFAIGSVWLYSKGVEDKPWLGQGLRFGFAIWLITSATGFLIEYATQPIGETLLYKQLGYEFVNKLILGAVTAAIVRRG